MLLSVPVARSAQLSTPPPAPCSSCRGVGRALACATRLEPLPQRSRLLRTSHRASLGAVAGVSSSLPLEPLVPDQAGATVSAFWKFLRPHTIRGTVLGTTAVVLRALSENTSLVDFGLVPRALLGLLALLCGNGYIVGINQIFDISIDKVNKPFLPVASGEMSVPFAWFAVVALAVLGGGIVALNFGPLITGLYSFGLFLGTIYSVPPLRLKRFPLPAFLIIATVRGFLLNFGVYYATRAAIRLPFAWSPAIAFITCFVTLFATVIAITKDLPDVAGDKEYGIETFATRLGVRSISLLATGLLLACYVGSAVLAVMNPTLFRAPVMAGGHLLLGAGLVAQTFVLDRAKYTPDAIQAFYRFIWTLFYSEYFLWTFC